jgi:hypothetical protein
MLAIAFNERGDAVNEPTGCRAEPCTRRRGLKRRNLGIQARLCFGRALRLVRAIGSGGELVCDLAEDANVALCAASGTRLVPVGCEGLGELVQ